MSMREEALSQLCLYLLPPTGLEAQTWNRAYGIWPVTWDRSTALGTGSWFPGGERALLQLQGMDSIG